MGKSPNKEIEGIFIEKKYHIQLSQNLQQSQNCQVWAGTFEENLQRITSLSPNRNLFLYVDPYGIKSLDFTRFRSVINRKFYTMEMLLNFNSFGFLREGCRLLNYNCKFSDEGELDDYEFDVTNNIEHMNEVAHGSYWQDIIHNYYEKRITMFRAEELLTSQYVNQLKELFKYVINIPVKVKTKNIPKYRLIFGTNNADGLLLMSDNMNKKWKEVIDQELMGQVLLIEEYSFPDSSVIGCNLDEDIISILEYRNSPALLKGILSELVQKHGIAFSAQDYKEKFKQMNGKKIKVIWYPECSPKGRKYTGFDYNNRDYKIYVGKL